MKIGEVWIMKGHTFEFYQGVYQEDDGVIQNTKVEILDIVNDIVYYMYLFNTQTDQCPRKEFLEDYEKVY